MKDWHKTLISRQCTILKAIEVIDNAGLQIALVVDENGILEGTITDGDVRRGILKGIPLEGLVDRVMLADPVVAEKTEGKTAVFTKMKQFNLHQIPIVDESRRVVGIEIVDTFLGAAKKNNWIIIMAGGQGSRLRPLTEERPKPLLQVGDKPLLETTVANLVESGFYRFFISVNYKANMFEEHFGTGKKFGAEITYLNEKEQMGTAGALSLLEEAPTEPFFVMNGDLLTTINLQSLLEFHQQQKAAATMCVREYDFQVPYGVIKTEHNLIQSIDEKPVQRFFINAGIYILNPEVLQTIKKNESLDMPNLFTRLIGEGKKVGAFPIREYWMDIGQMSDLLKANMEFSNIFK